MASDFSVYATPASIIDFLHANPGSVQAYLEGNAPDSVPEATLPADWPAEPPKSFGSWGINHRNCDLYHWILNGSGELTTGSGCIFQTWFEPDQSDALKLDDSNERFAFRPDLVVGLAELVDRIHVTGVMKSFVAWGKAQGKHFDVDEDECASFIEEFGMFRNYLTDAIRRGDGIVW